MNVLKEIQNWYHSECNKDWEHTFGIKIDTLDNPGWIVIIDLTETGLENIIFQEISYGVKEESATSGDNWIWCKVEDQQFKGSGGPEKLEEILEVFLKWSKSENR